jgi:hypothetical protein
LVTVTDLPEITSIVVRKSDDYLVPRVHRQSHVDHCRAAARRLTVTRSSVEPVGY